VLYDEATKIAKWTIGKVSGGGIDQASERAHA